MHALRRLYRDLDEMGDSFEIDIAFDLEAVAAKLGDGKQRRALRALRRVDGSGWLTYADLVRKVIDVMRRATPALEHSRA